MTDIILGVVIAAILFCAGLYIFKAKKNGQKCIGCPYSKECGKDCCKTKK